MSAGNDPNDISRIGVKSVAQHGVPSYVQHDDDDHEEHIDERWLVSYADMMTLLFGLFVLLFSMSTLDPKTANQIKASAEQTFNEKEEEPASPPPDRTPELEARIAALQEEAVKTSEKVAEQSQKIDWLEDKLSKVPKPKLPEPEKLSREPELEAELKKREREIEKLKTARDEVARQLASASADAPAAAQAAQRAAVENEKLKEELEATKEKLKKEVESLNGGRGQDFMAFFINWATKDHDVDLVIQDPSGKVFDFKRREYQSHPGLFALDTRRGPGVELWQSKNILPGRYKATYSLYNDYGNSETAPVNAVILTPKGSFELPLSRLDTKGNRRATAEFEVDKNGGVRIVNAGK